VAWLRGQWQEVYAGQEMPDAVLCGFAPVATNRLRLLVKNTTDNTPAIREMGVFGPWN
jgi:hypothetical protein